MAQFSVKDAAKFSLAAYGKHCVLLLSAAALVGGSWWVASMAPRFVADKLGIQAMDMQAIGMDMMQQSQDHATDQSTMVLQRIQEVTTKIFMHLQMVPKHLLALVLLVWLFCWGLYLTLVLGMMKLGLSIRDKDSGSLAMLLAVSPRQVARFLGASLLLGLYALCGFIGIAVLTIPCGMLLKGLFGDSVLMVLAMLLWLIVFVAMIFWLVGYSFYGYLIVDKPNIGAREALRMSRALSHGSRRRIVAAVLVLMVIGVAAMFVAQKLAMMACTCSVEQQRSLTALIVMVVSWPFSIPFFAFIYRSLGGKGK